MQVNNSFEYKLLFVDIQVIGTADKNDAVYMTILIRPESRRQNIKLTRGGEQCNNQIAGGALKELGTVQSWIYKTIMECIALYNFGSLGNIISNYKTRNEDVRWRVWEHSVEEAMSSRQLIKTRKMA